MSVKEFWLPWLASIGAGLLSAAFLIGVSRYATYALNNGELPAMDIDPRTGEERPLPAWLVMPELHPEDTLETRRKINWAQQRIREYRTLDQRLQELEGRAEAPPVLVEREKERLKSLVKYWQREVQASRLDEVFEVVDYEEITEELAKHDH